MILPLLVNCVSVADCVYVSFSLLSYELSSHVFSPRPVPLIASRAKLCVVCSQKCLLNKLLVYVDPINQIIA